MTTSPSSTTRPATPWTTWAAGWCRSPAASRREKRPHLAALTNKAVRSELLTRLCDSWSSITGQDRRRVTVSLDEVDASSRMEGGMILPSFGDEAIWARAHAHELAELGWRD